jgi:hypothetical protein
LNLKTYKVLKFKTIARSRYTAIDKIVKLFSVRSAELGEPSRLLFVAKLANPLF